MNSIHWKALALGALFAVGTVHAQTAIQQSGGYLTLTTPGGDQNVKVEVAGSTTRLFGFPGVADGRSFEGLLGVSVATGSGNDQVEFDVETAQSFDVRINTGAGASSALVQWKILPGTAAPIANLEVRSGSTGERKVLLELESENNNATFQVDAGSASELVSKVISSNTSNRLRIGFAGTSPKSSFEVVSAAAFLDVDVRGGGTAGPDELVYKISQTRPAEVNVNWALNAGEGSDKVEAFVSASGSTVTQRGAVQGRGGDDFLLFETDAFSTVTGLNINGGLGADQLYQVIKGRFQNSQTLQTILTGGDGDDVLVLTTDTGIFGTGLPNDLFSVIDCGPGNDRFQAFGVIRSCEARL